MVEAETIFQAMAWVYTFMWSLSFYPPIFLNCSLQNVEGYSLNYLLLNFHGFTAYTIYNAYGYWIDSQVTGLVSPADLFFAVHGVLLILVASLQACIFPTGKNRLHRSTILFCTASWAFFLAYLLLEKTEIIRPSPKWSLISWMGYYKMIITMIKYLPQAVWNFVRQTTHGWSITAVLLDFGGGIFSSLEVVLRCFLTPNYQLNVAKFGLGLLSIGYNVIFIVQHYCLYSESTASSQPLELIEQDLGDNENY